VAKAEGLLYEGKAKKVYATAKNDEFLVEYKDSLTAFNAQKKGSFAAKGSINRDITSLLFRELAKTGVPSHWVADTGDNQMLVKALEIIPLEVVVRNTLAGSTAKKLGLEEGRKLPSPLVEFYFKKDELNDPFVSDDQILLLGIAQASDLVELKTQALRINAGLQKIFAKIDLQLVDFKVEFGKTKQGQILLGDEITPDCCRLWDMKTNEKMDKDRFRRDLGGIAEAYQEVLRRLRQHFQ